MPTEFTIAVVVAIVLAKYWLPLGPDSGFLLNLIFVVILLGLILFLVFLLKKNYERMLNWSLEHKLKFLSAPFILLVCGGFIWRGMGNEFMPSLDEGSFLYMPTTMPHASIGEALDVLA